MKSLKLSESFYSVQCEGVTTGVPSYFVRLTGCNLSCGMSTAKLLEGKKNGFQKQGCFKGDLHEEGKATWTCDTIPVWIKGNEISYDDFYERLIDSGQLNNILNGYTHLIWTGGEPTMPQHVDAIMGFLDYLYIKHPEASPYSEIETNGTLVVKNDEFYGGVRGAIEYISQINCSAKLSNSGMPENRRINPEAIDQIMQHKNYWFKFVVSTEDDIKEFMETYVKPFNIPRSQVIIMPGVDKLEDMPERTRWLYEMSKKYGYRGITRGHILAWDQTTGV